MELPDPPEGWEIQAIYRKRQEELAPGEDVWFCSISSAEEYVYAWGTTMRYAVLTANRRIEEGDVIERLSGHAPLGEKAFDILSVLEIPKAPFVRRA